MDFERADQIIHSKGIVEVWYRNDPVWLESLQTDHRTVHVKNLNTRETMNIPLSELQEK